MKKNSITQFVGFITDLDFDEFVVKWEHYAKQFMANSGAMTLQQEAETKSRYKYVSQHECLEHDFRFAFMKGRSSEHFPEQKVKVVQAGGYTPVQIGCRYHDENVDAKVMAFISHHENDIDFYRQLSSYRYLNIYEAYYESCTYGHILEFFTPETDVPDLLQQLKTRPGTEVAIYRECLVPHS